MDGYILSPEHRKWKRSLRCPKCNKYLLNGPRVRKADGKRPLWQNSQSIEICPKCGQSWNRWVPIGQLPAALEVKKIVETVQTEEPIGDEVRTIDNSGTSASSVYRVRVSRRWAQKCEIQIERATTTAQGVRFKGPGDLMGYESTLEAAVRKTYAMSTEEEQTFNDEIEVAVPPGTMINVHLRWKRLWQEGYIILGDRSGQAINVPFRSAIRITCNPKSVNA